MLIKNDPLKLKIDLICYGERLQVIFKINKTNIEFLNVVAWPPRIYELAQKKNLVSKIGYNLFAWAGLEHCPIDQNIKIVDSEDKRDILAKQLIKLTK